jgi:hypothetical protein
MAASPLVLRPTACACVSLSRCTAFVFCFCTVFLYAGPFSASTFSSYDPPATMLCPGSSVSPLRDGILRFPDTLVQVNWLLNTYYIRGQGFAPSCTLDTVLPPGDTEPQNTPAGTYGPITKAEMQSAVWVLTGGC